MPEGWGIGCSEVDESGRVGRVKGFGALLSVTRTVCQVPARADKVGCSLTGFLSCRGVQSYSFLSLVGGYVHICAAAG